MDKISEFKKDSFKTVWAVEGELRETIVKLLERHDDLTTDELAESRHYKALYEALSILTKSL